MVLKIAYGAGHGINTAGKRTPDNESEWYFNNIVATAFGNEISTYSGTELLRTDDPTGKTDVPLKTRTDKANKWGADVYVSFHHNANTGKWGDSWTGTEVHVYKTKPTESVKLAEKVHPVLAKAYGLKDRGIKYTNLHITRETKCTAILIEGGFMDSLIDIKKLRDKSVLEKAGKEVARAVAEFYGLKKKSGSSKPKTENKPAPKPAPKEEIGDFVGKRVESIYKGKEGLNFYNKPSWDAKDRVGVLAYGIGFPEVLAKVKVGSGYQYKVKNSKGQIFYVTASPKYVKLVNKSKAKPSYIGKRVESIHNGNLRFYSRASWSDKYVAGYLKKGCGFPTILEKIKVRDGYQYKVKNSRGAIYYVTASSKYVKVV
jgi:N-acetylmuramoyl-L-alanine amidase CwlA